MGPMNRQKKGKRKPTSESDVAPNIGDADSVIHPSVRPTHNEITECDRETQQALARHLHDLRNSLWAAAIQIELAFTEESCPVEFRKTLEQVQSHIQDAAEIASRTSNLIDSSPARILGD